MLESPKQCHLKVMMMRLNKFISVFAYDLRLGGGGHFGNSCIFSAWSMHRGSQTMYLEDNSSHGVQMSANQ